MKLYFELHDDYRSGRSLDIYDEEESEREDEELLEFDRTNEKRFSVYAVTLTEYYYGNSPVCIFQTDDADELPSERDDNGDIDFYVVLDEDFLMNFYY